MKICARCDRRIVPGEDFAPVDHISQSGPGLTVYVHATPCKRAQIQSSPNSRTSTRRAG